MKEKSLREMYIEAKQQPTEPQKLMQRISDATSLSLETARQWLVGTAKPGKSARALLEREFGTPWEVLFPELAESKEQS